MRQCYYFLCLLVCTGMQGHSQGLRHYYKRRAEINLNYLTQSHVLLNRVKISEYGIDLFTKGNDRRTDFRIYWNEVPHLIKLIETQDRLTLKKIVGLKKNNRFATVADGLNTFSGNTFPTDIKGLRIALDAGHFGGNLAEARWEGRVVNVHGSDVGLKEDVHFFEADLNYMTALLLKKKLDSAGAVVLMTRPYGAGALGKGFKEWLRTEAFQDIEEAQKEGDITRTFYDTLKNAIKDSTRQASQYYLFQLYKFKDFIARSAAVNAFHPDISFVLHYNIREGNRPSEPGRYITPVNDNYSMAFVPGSFEYDELEKEDQKLDFVRLLLSSDLQSSVRLANIVLQKHQQILKVPPIPFDSLRRLKSVVIKTEQAGVFCRNLYMTRSIRGTVVYGESLYQDNIKEIVNLATLDRTVIDRVTGEVFKTSSRCELVAQAYFEAILEFLRQNIEQQQEYDEALMDVE